MEWTGRLLWREIDMWGRVKSLVMYLGLVTSYGFATLFVWTFLKAYSTSDKAVVFAVNTIGEAHLEYLLFLVLMPVMTLSLFYAVEELLPGQVRKS
ncbi:hypothetical protein ASZ90_009062 [hydrocarbon metagenome]|uniref:Uncharacterized protein n=1 Tax=hydrocarbon metagenome TaxID=938273 RepID=A0A0W8FJW0_9ZZZZ